MRDRCCQLNVAHPFAADLLQRDFHTAFFADNAAIFHALVFAAQALVILDRAKYTRAEQAVTLGLERAVVDRLGFLDLTERPRQNPLWRGQRDLDFVKGFRRCERVKRVVCQFLVHFDTSNIGWRGKCPKFFIRRILDGCENFRTKILAYSSSSASRSSMLRPRPRTSFTSTLNDSGTPASKLSSPLTMLS